MGTHPIFESDFDCLTEMDLILVASSAKKLLPKLISRPKCPVDNLVSKLSLTACHSPYTGDGTYTELYYAKRRPPSLLSSFSSSKFELQLKTSRRHMSSTVHRRLSKNDIEKAKARKQQRVDHHVESSKARLQSKATQRRVPSSRLDRAVTFGTAGVGLGLNFVKNRLTSAPAEDKFLRAMGLTEGDVQALVDLLCQARGAALKLAQMISIQDDNLVSPGLAAIFERVRQTADYMPERQVRAQLDEHLPGWQTRFAHLDLEPFAAASIGQVHQGRTHEGEDVVIKIQYPGVAESINSDIDNLMMLLRPFQARLPKQLFLDNVIAFARRELAWECDYDRELESCERMRALLADDEFYYVPKVYRELSSKRILTTEFVHGQPIDKVDFDELDQSERNHLGRLMLRLCIREVFEFRFMQTDPNFSNFLYEPGSNRVNLIDMGACRDYSDVFVTPYLELVAGAVKNDRETVLAKSRELGFLTGAETGKMETAHVNSVMVVGKPYQPLPYDFKSGQITADIAEEMPAMFEGRLSPPPPETYSLHRKLSGAFLMCSKIGSITSCRDDFISTLDAIGRQDLIDEINASV